MTRRQARRQKYGPTGGGSARTYLIAGGAGVLVAVVIAVGAIILMGGDDTPARSSGHTAPVIIAGATTQVDIVDTEFKPKDIVVSRGTRVSWLNKGDLPHNVTDDRDRFNSENMSKGDVFEQKFDTPGEYYYYCTIHHTMLGSVVVSP
jgi:plastocyanin